MNNLLQRKPFLINATRAHKSGIVKFLRNGTARITTKGGTVHTVPPNHQYDLTQATIFGLNERLTSSATSPVLDKKGGTLRDAFNKEWRRYEQALSSAKGFYVDYGVYALYHERGDLVRYCDPFWHRVVAVASSSKLITDPGATLTWKQIRDVFESSTIAVAGGSVGNSILHCAVMDMRPRNVKIADKSLYKMENINRVRLSYEDVAESNDKRAMLMDMMLRNKALVTAEQLYRIDPYLNVYCYPEGVNLTNINEFLGGHGKEPKADIMIEEVDDPRIKLLLREEARTRRIPLVMATDVGSCVQIDVLRYDKDSTLPLTFGSTDDAFRASVRAVEDNPGNREIFFTFVDMLIGADYRRDELAKIIDLNSEIPTSTIIPQLGSTAAAAAGVMAETVARMLLGHNYPSRVIINKRTFEVKIYQ